MLALFKSKTYNIWVSRILSESTTIGGGRHEGAWRQKVDSSEQNGMNKL